MVYLTKKSGFKPPMLSNPLPASTATATPSHTAPIASTSVSNAERVKKSTELVKLTGERVWKVQWREPQQRKNKTWTELVIFLFLINIPAN